MKITYDQEADVLLIVLKDATPVDADTLDNQHYIMHYDEQNQLVSIEILQASKNIQNVGQILFEFLPIMKPTLKSEAQKP